MERNNRPEIPPASLDLAGTVDNGNELTRTSSDASSLTAENSKDTYDSTANARTCMEWTDEKHCSYLDSLEASFVKQLHCSRGLIAWCSGHNSRDANAFQRLPADTCNSSSQFVVLQDGRWQKINFQRSRPLVLNAASHHFLDSPWIRHFTRTGKGNTSRPTTLHMLRSGEKMVCRGKRAFSRKSVTSLEHLSVHLQNSVGSTAEVSDQNFVNDDLEESSSTLSTVKRLRMDAGSASSQDQIVPCGSFRESRC